MPCNTERGSRLDFTFIYATRHSVTRFSSPRNVLGHCHLTIQPPSSRLHLPFPRFLHHQAPPHHSHTDTQASLRAVTAPARIRSTRCPVHPAAPRPHGLLARRADPTSLHVHLNFCPYSNARRSFHLHAFHSDHAHTTSLQSRQLSLWAAQQCPLRRYLDVSLSLLPSLLSSH